MAALVKWSGYGGIQFYIKNTEFRGVKDFNISTSTETEDTTSGGEKFIKKKNSGSYQITMTAVLNAALGVDVQKLALQMAEAARRGEKGYFYTYGAKLFTSNFMATDAKINDIHMTPKGVWSECEVQWTLKQCSKYDGSTGSSKTKKNTSSSTKKKTTTTTKTSTKIATPSANTSIFTAAPDAAKAAITKQSTAKQQSAAVKQDANTKNSGSGGGIGRVVLLVR